MTKDNYIETNFLEVNQPIGSFYVCVLSYDDILAISSADVRALSDESTIDNYLGIQRKLSKNRVKEISQYVTTIDATFPTSVILSIKTLNEFGESNKNIFIKNDKLYIKKQEDVASILDGQHRLEGMRESSFDGKFDLNVTIFIDADIDDQAQIFSVINKAQTKVNKSLVYDLYEYATHRSPQKSCHDIVRLLNKNEKSPFYKKIKILGTAHDKDNETIAQATLVELLLKYISRNPMKDRDILRRNSLFHKLEKAEGNDKKSLIFRNLFIEEKEKEILKILIIFFNEVKNKWPKSWDGNKIEGNVLNKTTGIVALMRFLKDLYNKSIDDNIEFNTLSKKYFTNLKILDGKINREVYPPGSTGQSKLYNELKENLF